MNMLDEDIVQSLSVDESWELLESHRFGRLAFAVANDPEIVPINYCVADRKLYFRTAEGSKLLGVTINNQIAFEIDEMRDGAAVSVIVKGEARELQTSAEIEFAEGLDLRTWVPSRKVHFLEITVTELSGRRFALDDSAD